MEPEERVPLDPANNPSLNGTGTIWSVYEKKKCSCHRERLILHYYPVVERVAAKLYRKTPFQVELADLVSIGTVGLILAVEGFNPCQGTPFEPYAAAKVRSVILDEARSRDWAPRSLRRRQKDIDTVAEELRSALLRDPTDAEIVESLELQRSDDGATWTQELLTQTRLATEASYPSSLDEPARTESGVGSRYDSVPDLHPEPDTSLGRNIAHERAAEFVANLVPQDLFILSLYYVEELTLAQSGAVAGIPETRAAAIHTKVVMELRKLLVETVEAR